MHRLPFLLGASTLALAACASDPIKRDPALDPSNPDAPQSRPVRVPSELAADEPTPERAPSPRFHGSDAHAGHDAPPAGPADATRDKGDHDHGPPSPEGNHSGHEAAQPGGSRGDGGQAPGRDQRSHGGMTVGGGRAGEGARGGRDRGAREGAVPGHAAAPDAGDEQPMYVCPMHPEVRQRGPGRCPKCGMKLVPEAAGDGGYR
jgi:Heavy metal binding domain